MSSGREPRVRRTAYADELHRDGECVVLLDDHAVRLGGVAPLLLELCTEWRTVAEVTAGLVEAYGQPPEGSAEALVEEALRAMEENGVVERERLTS